MVPVGPSTRTQDIESQVLLCASLPDKRAVSCDCLTHSGMDAALFWSSLQCPTVGFGTGQTHL